MTKQCLTEGLTIGKLAAAAQVGVETVRYYQRSGLIEVPSSQGSIRYYHNEHLRRLRFIKKAQLAGFSLKEIKQLLAMDASEDHTKARELATQRLTKLDQQLKELQQARASLQKLAQACQHATGGPCPIIASFE